MSFRKQDVREIGRNFPDTDLGIKKTKNSFQEGGKSPSERND